MFHARQSQAETESLRVKAGRKQTEKGQVPGRGCGVRLGSTNSTAKTEEEQGDLALVINLTRASYPGAGLEGTFSIDLSHAKAALLR